MAASVEANGMKRCCGARHAAGTGTYNGAEVHVYEIEIWACATLESHQRSTKEFLVTVA
jgi:hypothetical protein